MSVSESNKKMARTLAGAFGGQPEVIRYWDEKKCSSVDVLICNNAPQKNVCTYGTIGLSDHPIEKDGAEIAVRVELVAAFGSSFEEAANVISTAAFCVMNSKWEIGPGVIFPDVVSMYRKKSEMKHVLFSSPFLWENLTTQRFEDKTVAWLMLIPVSEKEYQFAEMNGAAALEDLFVSKQIDLFNLDRVSAL